MLIIEKRHGILSVTSNISSDDVMVIDYDCVDAVDEDEVFDIPYLAGKSPGKAFVSIEKVETTNVNVSDLLRGCL